MIKLYDNLYLSADPKNLILIKDDGETDKKGRPVRKTRILQVDWCTGSGSFAEVKKHSSK